MELRLSEILDRTWVVAKRHGGFVLLVSFVSGMASNLSSSSVNEDRLRHLITDYSSSGDLHSALQHYQHYDVVAHLGFAFFLAVVLSFAIGIFLDLVTNKLLWKGVSDYESAPNLTAAIRSSFNNHVWKYMAVQVILSLVSLISVLCCVLPALYVGVRLLFVGIIAANNPELSISEVFSRSWNLTKGHYWKLFGYGIVSMLINIAGFCCCCVGVIFTGVYTQFMLAECYYRLLQNAEQAEPVAESEYQKSY